VKVESGQTVPEAIAALEKRADVRFAEPNWIYQASSRLPMTRGSAVCGA
jgi:hypothetical protein